MEYLNTNATIESSTSKNEKTDRMTMPTTANQHLNSQVRLSTRNVIFFNKTFNYLRCRFNCEQLLFQTRLQKLPSSFLTRAWNFGNFFPGLLKTKKLVKSIFVPNRPRQSKNWNPFQCFFPADYFEFFSWTSLLQSWSIIQVPNCELFYLSKF